MTTRSTTRSHPRAMPTVAAGLPAGFSRASLLRGPGRRQRKGNNSIYRYLPLPAPITGTLVNLENMAGVANGTDRLFRTVTRARMRFEICPLDIATRPNPGCLRGLYLDVQGWLGGDHSRYGLYDRAGVCVALIAPVPEEPRRVMVKDPLTGDRIVRRRPRADIAPLLFLACQALLKARDEHDPDDPVIYRGYTPWVDAAVRRELSSPIEPSR